jgi:flagellar biosynthesis activator protein FlaF
MTKSKLALSGYAAAAHPVRTDRGTEYKIFARITSSLKAIDEADKSAFPALAEAVFDNQRLWGLLANDLKGEANALPIELRTRLLSLAEFVRKHSYAVLGGRASVEPLIDINTSIMRGLCGSVEVAA